MTITDFPNMGTVNHPTEDLQHRMPDFSKCCSVIGVRGKDIEQEERVKQKSSGKTGWQNKGNMTDVDTLLALIGERLPTNTQCTFVEDDG